MVRKTKEEAAITRQMVLEAALVVFSDKGYAATTLEDIAKQAGMTRGAIYWHFRSKADLYNTLVSEISQRAEAALQPITQGEGTFLDILRRVFVRSLELLVEDEQLRRVNELVLFKTEVTPELAEGMEMKRRGTSTWIDYMAGLIAQGQAEGDVRADLDPRDGAFALLALQNGIFVLWLTNPQVIDLKGHAESLAEVYIRGIAAT